MFSRTLLTVVSALCTTATAFVPQYTLQRATVVRQSQVFEADSDAHGTFRYDNSDSISPLEKQQAISDTANWCLERCIALGHCEVLEDLNKMTTAQVQDFCKACILEGENTNDECDISFMFAPDAPWGEVELPPELAKLKREKV